MTVITNRSDKHHGFVDVTASSGQKARWILGPGESIRKRIAASTVIDSHSNYIVVNRDNGFCCKDCAQVPDPPVAAD